MPATSKVQQKAAGAAQWAKRGETPKSTFRGASRAMYGSMSEAEFEVLSSTGREHPPAKKGGG